MKPKLNQITVSFGPRHASSGVWSECPIDAAEACGWLFTKCENVIATEHSLMFHFNAQPLRARIMSVSFQRRLDKARQLK